jgi:hypothetical protein
MTGLSPIDNTLIHLVELAHLTSRPAFQNPSHSMIRGAAQNLNMAPQARVDLNLNCATSKYRRRSFLLRRVRLPDAIAARNLLQGAVQRQRPLARAATAAGTFDGATAAGCAVHTINSRRSRQRLAARNPQQETNSSPRARDAGATRCPAWHFLASVIQGFCGFRSAPTTDAGSPALRASTRCPPCRWLSRPRSPSRN